MKLLFQSKLLFVIIVLGLLNACKSDKNKASITNGVYWWNGDMTRYNSNFELYLPWLKTNQISKIYYKQYDIDWNNAQGIFPINGMNEAPSDVAIRLYHQFIPCIFITNKVFENANESELKELSERLAAKIDSSFLEYQIDCDWSAGTRDKYFLFLDLLKQKLPKHIQSVTIRLFQYKYPDKTGIPPADRGALMLYNFNSPKNYSEQNSIFDKEEALKYVSTEKYKLPLDFILPSFSWSIIYANKVFVGLLRNFDAKNALTFCNQKSKNIFESKSDTVLEDFYIRKGNEIKVEDMDAKSMQEANDLIAKFKNTDQYTVSIFSLSDKTKSIVHHEVAKSIYRITE
jgi:hypothetical protein